MVRQQFLTGMPFFKLLKLLVKYGFDKMYFWDVVRLLKVGLISSIFSVIERLLYNVKIKKTHVTDAPIFIIGHWRSGTTYLQKILAQDNLLTTPTFYQCTFPQSFIVAEKFIKPVLLKLLPSVRIFDAMVFGVDEPFDDDFAIIKFTLTSRMLHFVFPKITSFNEQVELYNNDKYCWSQAFMHFARKLTFVKGRRLLFKSPMNTFRIEELLELFPKAKFIYIYRRPEDVYVSSLYQAKKLFEHNVLQENKTDVEEFILSRYLSLYDAYEKHKTLIPKSQLIEVSFESLKTSPIEVAISIYEKLGIKGVEEALPNIKIYLEATKNYKNNIYTISEKDYSLVNNRWSKAYDAFGYAKNTSPDLS